MTEGTFSNGDTWNGGKYQEDGIWWFLATDSNGNEYETDEVPETEPLFTMRRFRNGATEEEVKADIEVMETQPKLFELHDKCPKCYWPLESEQCKECGYVLSLGYCVRIKAGRCANGFENGKGYRTHAVEYGQWKALCGTEPGRRSAGWSSWHPTKEVTCPKCKKMLVKG